MNLRFLISLFAILALLSGCAFKDGEGEDSANAELARQQTQQREDLKPLLGVWRGTLTRGSARIPIELKIDEKAVANGRDHSGNTIYRYDAKGTFRSTEDTRFPDQALSGRYEKRTGLLVLTVPAGPNGNGPTNPDDLESISLTFDAGARKLTGDLNAVAYTIGQVELTYSAAQQDTENRDTFERQQRQARADLQPVLGRWNGTLSRGKPGTADYVVTEVELQLFEKKTPAGTTSWGETIYRFEPRATLRSIKDLRYRQMNLDGIYTKTTGDLYLSKTPINADDVQSLTLKFATDTISGEVHAAGYMLGQLNVTLTTRETIETQDTFKVEAEIQRGIFRRLAGAYYGPVTLTTVGTDRECRKFNVCLQIYMQEESTPRGLSPYLLSSHYREDMRPGFQVAEPLLAVSYNDLVNPQTIMLTSKGVSQPRNDKYIVTVTGQFAVTDSTGTADISKIINATYVIENLSLPGTAELKRVPACPKRPDDGRCLERTKP